jgi:two-component system, chemotaxis family, CheB/CheR fusion protein
MANQGQESAPQDLNDGPLPRGSVDERDGSTPFPVVGIGASAGGLEALRQLLSNLPTDTGMAFVVVQHLDPHYESRLPDLLAHSTSIPVVEAEDGRPVVPDQIYVIQPNTTIAFGQGVIRVTPRPEGRNPHLPVDHLFRSLAEDQLSRAIAVVLSGTGSDGTQGVCEVKAVGGITFAQEQSSATHPGMPRSAIESGCVDFVLPPDEIAHRLAAIVGHPYLAVVDQTNAEPAVEGSYERILSAVRAVTGVDFSQYRDTTIRRRIQRRMALHGQSSLAAYADRLRDDRGEVDALYHDLLINVTSFFRDPEMFETLKSLVLPELVKDKSPAQPVRVWVPGCSAGQEVYSLAMALIEFFDDKPTRSPIQIFGTDLAETTALEKARRGAYPEGIEAEVSPARLRRFFHRDEHMYRIDKSLRDMCVFARHNVTSDPPFSHLDLISCRNVLIYLTTPLQKRILSTFHYALNVPGYLVLGGAETVGDFTDMFELTERTHRIYTKKPAPGRFQTPFSAPGYKIGEAFVGRRPGGGPAPQDFQREADRLLLGRFAPPGVLVDENFDILQFRGRTAPFLEVPSGEPTNNLLKMAGDGLFLELRNGLAEARRLGRPVRREGIRVVSGGQTLPVTLEVVPVRSGESHCYLVLFQEGDGPPAGELRPAPEPVASDAGNGRSDLLQLRNELTSTREYLQSLVEERDAANEELRSANEEVLSSNEELQSTNEELETAKEELQSANEELTTVNEQLQRRNQELDQANNDLTNLLVSTNIPVVMVGGDLRIRRVTAPAKQLLGVLPTDVGRSIGELKPALLVPELEQLIGDVLDQGRPVTREIRDRDGRWFLLGIHPYRNGKNRIDGAVLVLLDVSELRRKQEELRRRSTLIELSQDAVVIRDASNTISFWNLGAEQMYGWTAEEAVGQNVETLLRTDPAAWAALEICLRRSGTWQGELSQVRKDGSAIRVHSREVLVRDEAGAPSAVLAIKRDITEVLRMVEALKDSDRRKDEFLATLAHELRNPLAPICNAVEVLRRAPDDPQALERTRDILERQVRQLMRIVEDLIDVTRVSEGKIVLRKERVALRDVVQTGVETCRSLMDTTRHELVVELGSAPLYVDADPVRLAQVVTNLLHNAFKYTEPGGSVRLTAERAGGERPREVLLRVQDNGMGIPAGLQTHIFDLFVQGEPGPAHTRGGLGVGLALVRNLVRLHDGTVTVHSDGPGTGAEFEIRLPLATPPLALLERDAAQPERRKHPRKRILVVEDNLDQLHSLGMLIRLMGHEVRLTENGPQALECAQSFRPQIVLLDIGLPGMSGYELARELRKLPKLEDVVLVAQTGWGQEADREQSRQAGIDRHLVKPVTHEMLTEILDV